MKALSYQSLYPIAAGAAALLPSPALAQDLTLDPIVDFRLRYEGVDQDNAPRNADAVTARLRAGVEAKAEGFFALIEGEATLAIGTHYDDTIPGNGIEPFSVVPDPDNLELNRAAIGYFTSGTGVTIGRQRIILDNARWVGNVGWRQNEQTFDAVRSQAMLGPVTLDATYSASQRTIFGTDSPNAHFDGDFILLNGGIELAPVKLKSFAYLLDYDRRIAFSSQTYGVLATADFRLGQTRLSALASYARQSDYRAGAVSYGADYYHAELGGSFAGLKVTAGYEELGSDGGIAAVQAPLATLHAFNGWADLFLTTPAAGLHDYYLSAEKGFALKALPGLKAGAAWHRFESDFGSLDYGEEWDFLLGFRLGPVSVLAKYARYDANRFGVDTSKFWLQTGASF